MIDFTSPDYLLTGNVKQKAVYRVLTEPRIWEKLRSFDPVLTGTIPINIDTDTSDLDIICCFTDARLFEKHLVESFGTEDGFKLFTPKLAGTVAASFVCEGFMIEIFGQAIPTRQQAAYLHMIIEYRILLEKGEAFRQQVIALKKQGYKTEPAFGKLLGIAGNVYEELLKLKTDTRE